RSSPEYAPDVQDNLRILIRSISPLLFCNNKRKIPYTRQQHSHSLNWRRNLPHLPQRSRRSINIKLRLPSLLIRWTCRNRNRLRIRLHFSNSLPIPKKGTLRNRMPHQEEDRRRTRYRVVRGGRFSLLSPHNNLLLIRLLVLLRRGNARSRPLLLPVLDRGGGIVHRLHHLVLRG